MAGQGIKLRDQFRSQHRQAFIKITHDWPEQKRLTFALLLIEYAALKISIESS